MGRQHDVIHFSGYTQSVEFGEVLFDRERRVVRQEEATDAAGLAAFEEFQCPGNQLITEVEGAVEVAENRLDSWERSVTHHTTPQNTKVLNIHHLLWN